MDDCTTERLFGCSTGRLRDPERRAARRKAPPLKVSREARNPHDQLEKATLALNWPTLFHILLAAAEWEKLIRLKKRARNRSLIKKWKQEERVR